MEPTFVNQTLFDLCLLTDRVCGQSAYQKENSWAKGIPTILNSEAERTMPCHAISLEKLGSAIKFPSAKRALVH